MLTTLNGMKVCTNCPYRYSLKYKKALEKKRNVPRKCPVPMCPASPFILNIPCHLQLVHSGLDPDTTEVSDGIVEKQIARPARNPKAEKGEKVRRIKIHVDKEAEKGTGQATTRGDEGGDNYGTQQPSSEAEEDWRPKRCKSDGSDGSDMDSFSTTNSSSGGTSSTSSEYSSESSRLDSSTKVVVATGRDWRRECTKRPPSNPVGKPSKRKVGRQRWQLHRRRSDKHQNGSRVVTPKGSGSR